MPVKALLWLWYKPRETFQLVDAGPKANNNAALLVVIAAYAGLMKQIFSRHISSFAIAMVLLLLPVFAIVMWYLSGWLMRVVVGWMGGQCSTEQARLALAWGGVPSTVGALLAVLLYLVYGQAVVLAPQSLSGPAVLAVWLTLLLNLYSLFTVAKMLAQAAGFSAWIGLAATITLLLICFVAILVVTIIFMLALMAVIGPEALQRAL